MDRITEMANSSAASTPADGDSPAVPGDALPAGTRQCEELEQPPGTNNASTADAAPPTTGILSKRLRLLEQGRIFEFMRTHAELPKLRFQGKLTQMQKRRRLQQMQRIQKWMELQRQSWTKQQWREYKQFLLENWRNIGPEVYYGGACKAYLQKQAQDKPPTPGTDTRTVPAVAPGEQAPPPGTNDAETTAKSVKSQKEKEEVKYEREMKFLWRKEREKILQQRNQQKKKEVKFLRRIEREKIHQQKLQWEKLKEVLQPSDSQSRESAGNHPTKQQTQPPRTENTAERDVDVDSASASQFLKSRPSIVNDDITWHKVVVLTPITDRKAVIKAINKQIAPQKIVPYFYCMEDGCITFLVNNSNAALYDLLKKNLKVRLSSGPFKEIELALKFHVKKMVGISYMLYNILTERLDQEKKFVDLSFLSTVAEFQEMVYDPSDITHLVRQLLELVPAAAPELASLSLAGNALESLDSYRSVFAPRTVWKSLRVLDLSYNKIGSLDELVIFTHMPLIELHLDQNPVCGQYKEGSSYISTLKRKFPRLIKVDGTYLHKTQGLPYWQQNYIHCGSGGDSGELADQFVEHFFTLYDAEDRTRLRRLYHKDAYFSVSSFYVPGQSTSSNARLTPYTVASGSLLRGRHSSRFKALRSRGVDKILGRLSRLPTTQHDPYSFTVDVLYNTGLCAVLTVTGVFRESSKGRTVSPRHFMRTFVLVALANREFQVVNDILCVSNATSLEAEEAFRYTRPHREVKKRTRWSNLTECDKDSMVDTVSQLTDMTPEWSRKYLADSNWDKKGALQLFLELYKQREIPEEAFKSHALRETVET